MVSKGICAYCGKEFDFIKREDGKAIIRLNTVLKNVRKQNGQKNQKISMPGQLVNIVVKSLKERKNLVAEVIKKRNSVQLNAKIDITDK